MHGGGQRCARCKIVTGAPEVDERVERLSAALNEATAIAERLAYRVTGPYVDEQRSIDMQNIHRCRAALADSAPKERQHGR